MTPTNKDVNKALELLAGEFRAAGAQVTVNPLPEKETRRFTQRDGIHRMGRSTILITCPFCGVEVEAFVWSLAGSGKRCPGCGAKHTYFGRTVKG